MFADFFKKTLIISTYAIGGSFLHYYNDLLCCNDCNLYFRKRRVFFCNDGFLIGGLIGIYLTLFIHPKMEKILVNID
tara:strand:+ start:61 stop:291 length:231 start_codon:yes stop_codon:yes gene_type:complete